MRRSPAAVRRPRELKLGELGQRVREQRMRRGMSLADLGKRSEVSRSMISAIERGSKAATVLVLDRIATGLDTTLAHLLADERQGRVIIQPAKKQIVAKDPSGWERRILSPVLPGVEFEFMRTTLGPGVDAGTFLPHPRGSREYVAVEKGTVLLSLDGHPHRLESGDSSYYDGDCLHGFSNPGRIPCVYYLVMDVGGQQYASNGHRTLSSAARRSAASRRRRQ